MGVYHGNIFGLDWTDLDAVLAVAKTLSAGGPRQIVFYNGRNYQITFAERREQIEREGYSVIWDSGS